MQNPVTRPPYRSPRLVLLVAAGGAVGTAARYGIDAAVGAHEGWPLGTLLVNLVGAFLLGLLLEALLRAGTETPRARLLRLGLGTGVLGGFTTFSSLALETERLVADGAAAVAVAYGATSLVAGVAAALAGVWVAAAHHRWRSPPLPDDPDQAELTGRDPEGTP